MSEIAGLNDRIGRSVMSRQISRRGRGLFEAAHRACENMRGPFRVHSRLRRTPPIAAAGVWRTGTSWPDLGVAALMAGIFATSSAQILRQAWAEYREFHKAD